MKNNILVMLKKATVFFCLIFAITTIASSVIQLTMMNQANDTNAHILNRAAIVLIVTIIVTLFINVKLKSKILSWIVLYVISMSLVFLYVWGIGHIGELSKHAYRDIFLNFTAIFAIISAGIGIKDKISYKLGMSRE